MNILILERDADVGYVLQQMLTVLGHICTLVDNAADVLTKISKNKFDVLLTNQIQNGFDLGGTLPWVARSMQPRMRIILTTTTGMVPLSDRVPIDAVLAKPFTIEQAEAAIAFALQVSQ